MQITWLGHGSFRIEVGGQILLVDPWLTGNPVLPETQHETAIAGATHLLLTHCHFDHVADALAISRKLDIPIVGQYDMMAHWAEHEGVETVGFNKGGTIDLNGVKVTMVNAQHSSSFATADGPKWGGTECGFVIEAEGHSIYHSGDTAAMADMEVINDLHHPDIGILSAGGHFTMDMATAAYAAKKFFDFKTVIPGHYRTFPILEQSADVLRDRLPGVNVIEPEIMTPITF